MNINNNKKSSSRWFQPRGWVRAPMRCRTILVEPVTACWFTTSVCRSSEESQFRARDLPKFRKPLVWVILPVVRVEFRNLRLKFVHTRIKPRLDQQRNWFGKRNKSLNFFLIWIPSSRRKIQSFKLASFNPTKKRSL